MNCEIMPIILSEELTCAKDLIDQAKLDEALEIVENFEKDKAALQKTNLQYF
jgi:hypothetical protein